MSSWILESLTTEPVPIPDETFRDYLTNNQNSRYIHYNDTEFDTLTRLDQAWLGNLDAVTPIWVERQDVLRERLAGFEGTIEVEDVLQTVAEKMLVNLKMTDWWEPRSGWPLNNRLNGWLTKIAINTARDESKRKYGLKTNMVITDPDEINMLIEANRYDQPPEQIQPEEAALSPYLAATDRAIELLVNIPDDFKQAMIAVDVNELSYEQAAEVLGIKVGTVKSRVYRGREILKGQIQRGEVTPSFWND